MAGEPNVGTANRWWHHCFDDLYAEYGLQRSDPVAVEKSVEFILDKLGLAEGDTVLDQCCGIGRIAIPLARRGVRIIGVDQIAEYTEAASEGAKSESLPCEWHTAEAFDFVAPEPCDAAINWFTSCGYDRDDEVNRRMFERAFDSLAPGGWFAVDYVHTARVLTQFKPVMIERRTREDGEMLVVIETRVDVPAGMFCGRWTFVLPDGERRIKEVENRTWLVQDLMRLLGQVGFVDLQLFGSTDGHSLELDSPRCIVIGQRPTAA